MVRVRSPLPRAAMLAITATSLGCPPDEGDKVGPVDTGPVCDRIHGATGVIIFEDDGNTTHFPDAAPDPATVTTSVVGPLSDGSTWGALFGGRWLTSADSGCNWDDEGGKLPASGDWELTAAGASVYAFDRNSGAGAVSIDDGGSWTATDAGEVFFGMPVVDPSIAGRLRAVQARGVITTEDDGTNWDVSGLAPEGALAGAWVWAGGLDTVAAVTSSGVYLSKSGGASWDSIGAGLVGEAFVGSRVAIHPDNADVIWVSGTDSDGGAIYSTEDAGASWHPAAVQRQVDLDGDSPLWPVPGVPGTVLSSWATSADDYGINLYRIDGDGIRTMHTSSYYGITDVGFRGDGAWIAAVHGVK